MLSRLTALGGLAAIAGGVLFGAAVILHPLRDGMSIQSSGVAYGAIHNVGVFGLMLELFALVGLYVQEADAMGRQGLLGFVSVFFGQALYICLLVVDGLRNPLLARFAPQIVHTMADSDPNQLAIVLPALLMFLAGYLAFGASLLRANTQPRLAGWLLLIGGPVYIAGGISIFILGGASYTTSLIEIAGAVPFSLGYILLGLRLRGTAPVPVSAGHSR